MRCQRCRGFMVCETFDDLNIKTNPLYPVTRCINCGCIEDAIVRANRFRRLEKTRAISRRRRMAETVDVTPIKIHAEEYASIS